MVSPRKVERTAGKGREGPRPEGASAQESVAGAWSLVLDSLPLD